MNKTLSIFAVIFVASVCSGSIFLKLNRIYITNLQFTKCNNVIVDPVSIENIRIQVGDNNHLHISGSLNTSEDLIAPVKASVTLKKKLWVGWIPVPCEKNIGSCNYMDLCAYGYPQEKECPPEFIANGVPCRCPIKKGNYTLPPSTFQFTNDRDVLTGKYKGNIFISHLDDRLACYNINFVLKEQYQSLRKAIKLFY